ncbi:DUF4177 domain-containing protein [Clostridiaceae bacterium M8S5]|nr:DUF4177 domain-containing protein [Clostridiaceae bacterium M8S5]
MYEYKFVKASIAGLFSEGNYKQIVHEYAKIGWRLVQIFPCAYNGYGKPVEIEIVLEKEIKEKL